MTLTAAEKQKRYRERMRANNPEKFQEAQRKNSARNKERKKIRECSENEKKKLRKQWRDRKKRQKNKLSENCEEIKGNENETIDDKINKARLAERKKCLRRLAIEKESFETKINDLSNTIKTLKKKCCRLIKKQKSLIEYIEELKAKKTASMIPIPPIPTTEMTPLSKTENFIENNLPNITTPEKQKVKKQLLTFNVLTTALQDTYANTKNNKERNIFKTVVENEITKKYKVKNATTAALGLKGSARRRKNILKKNNIIINEIKQFYERDDVSRATAGKNEVKTFKKNKKQRRYLLKTQNDLYKKYKLEGGKAKKSSFKKYRPFYVLPPKLSNRETCACIKHENIMLKIKKFKSIGMMDTDDLDKILSKVQCDLNSKECAYEECSECKNKLFISFNWGSHNRSDSVTYEEFKLEKQEYINKKDNKILTTNKTIKKENQETLEALTEKFNKDIKIMKKHVYNIKHQYTQFNQCIKNLQENEVAIIIDFSENYTCKLAKEVQGMHFAGSKAQITLHTGVLYTNGNKPQAFASISPSNEHGPEAIWAHLEPILDYIKTEIPAVKAVHFFSDGPTSQYKQKKNFFLFAKYTKLFGFPYSTWNFSEASHGKGAADGVGGGLKRRLDGLVSHGTDISNAETAFKVLKESDTSVMMFYISETDIAKYSISESLTPVPQTMALHQIANTEESNTIKYRCLSCFCHDMLFPKGYCGCLDVKNHLLVQNKETSIENEIEDNPEQKNKSNRGIKRKRKTSELSVTTDSEQEQKENKNEKIKISKTSKKKKTKVTILSEVIYRPENSAFCNIALGPLNLTKIKKSDNIKKVNIYDNPTPSTSGQCKRQKITQTKNSVRKAQPATDSDSSSTDDAEYSVHDTSDDEIFVPEYDSFLYDNQEVVEDTENKKNMTITTVKRNPGCAQKKVEEISEREQFKETMIKNTDEDSKFADTIEKRQLSVYDSVKVPGNDIFVVNENVREKNQNMEIKRVKENGDSTCETVKDKLGNDKVQFVKTEIKTTYKEPELPDTKEKRHASLDDSIKVPGNDIYVEYSEENIIENNENIKMKRNGDSTCETVKDEPGNDKVQFDKTEIIITDKEPEIPDTKEEREASVYDSVKVPGNDICVEYSEENIIENNKNMELKRNGDSTCKTVKDKPGNDKVRFEKTEIKEKTDNNYTEIPDIDKERFICVGDSVLVRYFQRQSWKYYVGFIESIKEDETVSYSVRFLKTTRKPTLKFVPTKRDRDIVSDLNIVKKIELELHEKAYFLKDFSNDQIYF